MVLAVAYDSLQLKNMGGGEFGVSGGKGGGGDSHGSGNAYPSSEYLSLL